MLNTEPTPTMIEGVKVQGSLVGFAERENKIRSYIRVIADDLEDKPIEFILVSTSYSSGSKEDVLKTLEGFGEDKISEIALSALTLEQFVLLRSDRVGSLLLLEEEESLTELTMTTRQEAAVSKLIKHYATMTFDEPCLSSDIPARVNRIVCDVMKVTDLFTKDQIGVQSTLTEWLEAVQVAVTLAVSCWDQWAEDPEQWIKNCDLGCRIDCMINDEDYVN